MQQGSAILTGRKHGPDVWQFRWSEKDRRGRRIYRKRVIGTVQQYPDAQAAREVTTALLGEINAVDTGCNITVEQICAFLTEGIEIRRHIAITAREFTRTILNESSSPFIA